MPDEYGYSQSGPPPSPPASFPEPNLPSRLRDEHPSLPRSYHPDQDYDDAQGETTDSTYGDTYPPWPEPKIQVGSQASQQPTQSPPMTASRSPSQSPTDIQNASGGPYSSGLPVFGPAMIASPSNPSTPVVGFPASPQEFDPTGQRILHPPMPVPLPFFRNTGKRRALIVGINYSLHPRPDLELKKCIDDAYGMANFLRSDLGFAPDDVRIMTNETPWDHPTEENIRDAMRGLVFDAQPHDSLVFYFSGHALQAKDMSGYEPNGLAECICAMDYLADSDHPYPPSNTSGLIADNVMHELMVKPLPHQCRLTAIYDSCHSATLLGLPHLYDSNGMVKPIRHPERLRILRRKASYAHIVSLSASKNEEEAFETERGGALRWAFIETVKKFGDTLTYKELLWSVRDYMTMHRYPQRPQLSTSHEIDTNLPFTT